MSTLQFGPVYQS